MRIFLGMMWFADGGKINPVWIYPSRIWVATDLWETIGRVCQPNGKDAVFSFEYKDGFLGNDCRLPREDQGGSNYQGVSYIASDGSYAYFEHRQMDAVEVTEEPEGFFPVRPDIRPRRMIMFTDGGETA